MRCMSIDHLICITGDSNGGARVVDPAIGEVLLTCPKTDVRSRDVYPYVVTCHYTNFGFGRAVPSGSYKLVRLIDDRACEILTLGHGGGWREAQPPPIIVPHDRGSPIAINGVLHFLAKEKLSDDSLLCFDLESEQWKTIEGPRKFVDAAAASVRMTELNGDLCMVLAELHLTDKTYNSIWLLTDQEKGKIHRPCTSIWLLTDQEKGVWTKAYMIPMAPSTSLYVPLRMLETEATQVLIKYSRSSRVPLVLGHPQIGTMCD
uniref:F-box associated beta-propeller type 3 domain-containing protein n=1 Tax=Aegilops tauschii TaxID=37682 RepID=M8CMV7_AEGTA